MSPFLAGGIAIFAFLILIFNAVPIAFSFALVGFVGLLLVKGFSGAFYVLGSLPFTWATEAELITIPLFVLMGQFAFYSRISKDLYDAAYKWVGRFPGGIGLATNLGATAFGACCGVSMAGCATFAAVSFPEMQRYKYDPKMATGCIIAGGSLSELIPPSVPFVIIGFLTQVSVGRLLIAGIMPGLLLSSLFLLAILVICIRNPQLGPKGQSFPLKDMFLSLRGITGMAAIFVIVIGGLFAGVFTPMEAGAAGAFGALIVCLAMRRFSFSGFFGAGRDTLKTTSMIFMLIICANIFNTFLSVCGLTGLFSTWLHSLTLPPNLIMGIILLIYIPLGMFMDIGAITLLTVPIFFNPLVSLGVDPMQLAVEIVLFANLGFMTPPVGLNAFIVSGITKVPLADVFKGLTPFEIIMLVGGVLIFFFPQIASWLPGLMMK